MIQILIIDSDDTLKKILKLNLMNVIDCDVIEKANSKQAIGLIEILPDIDLIICREKVGPDNTGLNIAHFLEKEKRKNPMIIIGNNNSTYFNVNAISSTFSWNAIIELACKILKTSNEQDVVQTKNEFVPVSIQYFLNLTAFSINCDVFLRVKKSENDFQYIKRLRPGDQLSKEEILKYQKSGLKDFYIPKENFAHFVNFVTAELVAKLSKELLKTDERLSLNSESYEVTLERIHSLGIDDQTIELVDESIASMFLTLQEDNNLAKFLNSLQSNKQSFAYAHSYLCCLILHRVIAYFDWQSAQIKEKLTYISYFHDIALKDSSLMSVNTFLDFKNMNISKGDKELISTHALDSSVLVEKFPKVPTGVSTIIKEHHGSKTGIDIPEHLSISIMPLSMMFIVVEDFVCEFLKIKGTPTSEDLKQIFLKLGMRYNKVTYQQTLSAIENMSQNKKPKAN